MITNVYSIYDGKGNLFNVPFFLPTEGMAIRSFQDLANDPKSTVFAHKEDYILYHVATYDDATGEFINVIPVKLVATATQFLTPRIDMPLEKMADAIKQNGKELIEAK